MSKVEDGSWGRNSRRGVQVTRYPHLLTTMRPSIIKSSVYMLRDERSGTNLCCCKLPHTIPGPDYLTICRIVCRLPYIHDDVAQGRLMSSSSADTLKCPWYRETTTNGWLKMANGLPGMFTSEVVESNGDMQSSLKRPQVQEYEQF
jgi:hypothetical protein